MSTAKEKGDLLEYAVHRIEEVMMESVPGLQGTHATVERNKRFPRGNATYEVDLWVTLSPDTPYSTHHLLECKNWKDPVGQDVILGVKTKRDLLGAAKAIIIARDFTKAAVSSADELGITLTRVSDDFISPIDALQWVFTTHEPQHTTMSVQFRGDVPSSALNLDYHGSICRWDGRIGRLSDLIWPKIEQHFSLLKRKDPRDALEGLHFGKTEFRYTHERGELFINEAEVAHYTIRMDYVVEIRHALLDIKFNVNGHGGFYRHVPPPGLLGGDNLSIEIVAKPVADSGKNEFQA